jgi:drug/metabolite transporter (DMT)-like permease
VPAPAEAVAPPTRVEPAPGWLVWTCLWIVYIVWGSTYLAIRVTVETMPPLLTGGVRFMIAGAVMYLVLLARGGREKVRFEGRELLPSLLIGGALVLGGNGLVMVAEKEVPSGLAALIIAAVPLWVVVMRGIVGESIHRGTLIGVAVGFAGVALLLLPGGAEGERGGVGGFLLVVLASLSWALGSFMSKRADLPDDPFLSTALQMLLGGALCIPAGLAIGESGEVDVGAFSAKSLAAFAYLVVVGSLIAFTAYVWLLQHAPISKVATYAYVNPVIAIFLGAVILSEDITATILLGALIIVCSVAAIVRRESG